MTADFTTHATNFTSALQTGVDPRTGQFFMSFPLLSMMGNHQLGPSVGLSLSYSSLSDGDSFGFGKGISLHGVSVYEQGKRISLSNGESWAVSSSGDILHRKLKDCVLKHGDDMAVHWKSGVTEILQKMGTDLYVTHEVIAPSGRKITLDWGWNGSQLLLRSVKDNEATLCRFDHDSLTLSVLPESAEERYTVGLRLQEGRLHRLERKGKTETLIWGVTYSTLGKRAVVSKLTHPTGLVDEVKYHENALKFPGLSHITEGLPAVSEHRTEYGRRQAVSSVHRYDYKLVGDNNFLGFGIQGRSFESWAKEHDFIYSELTDWKGSGGYVYGSTQTILMEGDTQQEIRRRYNNYHLLVSEEMQQGDHHVVKELDYHAKINHDIESQPAFYHFPKSQTVTYKIAGTSQQRRETTAHTFDDYGNPLTIQHPDGTEETFSWYAANGENDACPAEPHGFVRFIKSRRTTAPVIDGFSVPVEREEHRYTQLGSTNCVVQASSRHYSDTVLLGETKTAYVSDHASPEFGRMSSIISTLHALDNSGQSYQTRQSFKIEVDKGRLKHAVTHRSHDGLETTQRTEQSLYTGLVYAQTDAQGVRSSWRYDDLGRIVEQSHADGTPYATKMTWTYSIERSGDDILGPVTSQKDAHGRASRTYFDGAGRVVYRDLYDLDISKAWYRVAEYRYDKLGRIAGEAYRDWTQQDRKNQNHASSSSIEGVTSFDYDLWGQQCRQHHVDGTVSHVETDPISLTQTRYLGDSTGSSRTGKVLTTLDPRSKKPVKVESFHADGQAESTQSYKWDGLGRMRESTDAAGSRTQWSYDPYHRVHEQILPDGSKVTKSYAGYLTGNHVSALHVHPTSGRSPHVAGTQIFDGLGRLKESVSGGRTTGFAYAQPHSPLPQTVTLPSGDALEYSYIAELGNAMKSVADKRSAGGSAMAQSYEYDAATRQLMKATEGNYHIDFGYTPAGAILSQKFTYTNGPGGTATDKETAEVASPLPVPMSSYNWTFSGLAESHTDVMNSKRSYTYDKLGRVTAIDDPVLTVTLSYDGLGRLLTHLVTTKETSPRTLTTTMGYDDFSREKMRTISDGTGKDLSVTQSWHKNGLIATRKTHKGTQVLSDEAFVYDKRNRLVAYQVSGTKLPAAPYGNLTLSHQTYEFDVLNNLTKVVTTHADNSVDTATFNYSQQDPTQLVAVHHTHQMYPKKIDLKYDAQGRLIVDEAGRSLSYDAAGRLASVKDSHVSGTYEYNALNQLVRQTLNDGESWALYYLGNELVNEVAAHDESRRFIKAGHACLAVEHQKKNSTTQTVTLTGSNQNASPVWTSETGKAAKTHAWAPYGQGETTDLDLGFNGERIDPVSRTYHLGNGYRSYNPVLMRFNAPDSLSPFGPGGINPYAYCVGDPINHTDPSGHISVGGAIGGIIGLVSLFMALPTGGASLAVDAALTAFDIAMGVVEAGAEASAISVAEVSGGTASGRIASTAFQEFREIWSTNAGYKKIKALSRTTRQEVLDERISGNEVVNEIHRRDQYRFDGRGGVIKKAAIKTAANSLDRETVDKYSVAMYQSARKSSQTASTYYRGQRISREHLRYLKLSNFENATVRSNGFMATSSRLETAKTFMKGNVGYPLLVKITGRTAIHMDSPAAVMSEAESVFTPYASFKVTGISQGPHSFGHADHYFRMELEEIPYDPKVKFYNNIVGGSIN